MQHITQQFEYLSIEKQLYNKIMSKLDNSEEDRNIALLIKTYIEQNSDIDWNTQIDSLIEYYKNTKF